MRLVLLLFFALSSSLCGAATSYRFVTPQNTSVAGGASQQFSVTFLDAQGHAAAGESVHFANDACGRFANGSFSFDAVTDATGTATATFTALNPAGITCWLTASDGVVATFNVVTYITAVSYPSAVTQPAQPLTGHDYQVKVSGIYGAYSLHNVDVSAQVVAPGNLLASISPATANTGASGSATFNVHPSGDMGSYDIVVSFSGHTQTLHIVAGADQVQDMWWSGVAENGWGMSLAQHASGVLFTMIYAYDAAGHPTWYAMPGGTWNEAHTVITGPLYSPRGSPFAAYDASRFVPGDPIGTATISFTTMSTAQLDYSIGGVSGTKHVFREGYGEAVSGFIPNIGDMWWGGEAQNGWGVGLMQQYLTLFGIWFTYDANGKPTWYSMPGGTWSDVNTYEGRLYSTTSSAWLDATYDPSKLVVTDRGPFSLHFNADGSATFAFGVDGLSYTRTLMKEPF